MNPERHPASTRQLLGRDDLLSNITYRVFSDKISRTKSNVHNFRFALRKLCARPGEAIHIRDMIRNRHAGSARRRDTCLVVHWDHKHSERKRQSEAGGVQGAEEFRDIPKVVQTL